MDVIFPDRSYWAMEKSPLQQRLAECVHAAGTTPSKASTDAGLSNSFVRDVLRGKTRSPSVANLKALAAVLQTTVEYLTGGEEPPAEPEEGWAEVPVMGFVGAGAEVDPEFDQVPPEGLDQISVPFPLPGEMIAFKVRGVSMLPVYRDGTVIIVYREQKRNLESFFGEEAAVRTAGGKRYIKQILRGSQSGLVNLSSWNAELIEDQQLEWIGEIFAVLPNSALRRVGKQGGVQGSLKLRVG